ncbi:translation initiation factor IF-2 [Flavobacteriaceae bacterium]|nr:translation initiation factor IF-2 [Flavobacteriaceae bacterium]
MVTIKDDDAKKSKKSTLTLSLKSPLKLNQTAKGSTTKSITKRGSAVQVTIKSRRSKTNKDLSNNKLSLKELEDRKNLLNQANLSNDFSSNNDILKKISDANKKDDEEVIVEPITKKEEISKTKVISKKENIEKNTPKEDIKEDVLQKNNYTFDDFNVLGKIQTSISLEKKDLEKKEEQKLEQKFTNPKNKISLKKDKKKSEDDDEGNNNDNKKSNYKTNNRRRSQTYLIEENARYDNRKSRWGKKKQKSNQDDKRYDKIIREVKLPDIVTVSDLSERMAEKTGDVVKKLFSMGVIATANQSIDSETAEIIIEEFGHKFVRVSDSDIENILTKSDNDNIEKIKRPPVVTIMGHVDHGKTSILDAIRETNVVSRESGGITQHVGAFNVKSKTGEMITFLDTPGHEAFTEMRSRGANVTDMVILVVAADDGVKTQTVEAINHAKAADVPIIVAINKIDKSDANPSNVKNELLNHGIVAEDLSGDTMFVEVSAKEKTNLDKLEEAILLQAEVMELKSPYNCKASGIVVESRIDKSMGVMTSVIIQEGTLKVSDLVIAGTSYGKIKTIINHQDKKSKIATPSVAIEILGLDKAPNAGDKIQAIEDEKSAREIISYREKIEKDKKQYQNKKLTKDIFQKEGEKIIKQLPIIVKGDVSGSVEALMNSVLKLNTDEVEVKIIHYAAGSINESDVSLAAVTEATIIGFNVRPSNQAKELANLKNINIIFHSIIYNVIDDIKAILGGMLGVNKTEESLGTADVRQVFKVSGVGSIAGCMVNKNSLIKRDARARLFRDNVVIYDGSIKALKRFKDDVKEVKAGFECGIFLENYDDIKTGDSIECYEINEEQRVL